MTSLSKRDNDIPVFTISSTDTIPFFVDVEYGGRIGFYFTTTEMIRTASKKWFCGALWFHMLQLFTWRHKQSCLRSCMSICGPQERRPPFACLFAGPQIRDPLNLNGAGCIRGATDKRPLKSHWCWWPGCGYGWYTYPCYLAGSDQVMWPIPLSAKTNQVSLN